MVYGRGTSSKDSCVWESRGTLSPVITRNKYINAQCLNISLVAIDSSRISLSKTGGVDDNGSDVEHIIIALEGTYFNDM